VIQILIYILVIVVVAGLVFYAIDAIPVQQPLNRWAKLAIVIVAAIAVIMVLLRLTGTDLGPPLTR
jgi:hypothetical protein